MKELYKNYPVLVDINGRPYSINTDFRLMMQFELSAQREDKNSIAEIISDF